MERFEIPSSPYFDIASTLECGQVFRFKPIEDGYRVHALDHVADVVVEDDRLEVRCDSADFFKKYFDFDTDYAAIQDSVRDGALLSEAIDFGRGIHILRQDPAEAIFSFIISQNNHIPRIKGIIERICEGLGEKRDGYYAFPDVHALAAAGEEYFASIGAGYRAAYLDRVAKTLDNEDISDWKTLDTENLRAKLLSLYGVGRKVADCILLFGFNRFDVFPVDTWIKKVFEEQYPGVPADKMSVLLTQKYGKYSGFVQQWLFYYKRTKKV